MKILLVEDDAKIAAAVSEGLAQEHYTVRVATTGEDGFFILGEENFDVVILDIGLPGRDGLEILRAIRRGGSTTQVLMLTARDGVDDRVAGLDAGADDYLVKPFAFSELLARLRALLRRGRPDQLLKVKLLDLEIDLLTRRVTRQGTPIDLTGKEYDLLEYLMRNQGHIVSRQMLAMDVWKETARVTPIDNVIDVHIARLRRKIDDPFHRNLLKTIRGVGFVINSEEVSV